MKQEFEDREVGEAQAESGDAVEGVPFDSLGCFEEDQPEMR